MLTWNPKTKKLDGKAKRDLKQYAMVKRCSDKKDPTEWNEWRKKNPREEIWLQGVNFSCFFLARMNLKEAHCQGTKFFEARCEKADFELAHCEGALFAGAYCKGGDFRRMHCEEADFRGAYCEEAKFFEAHCEGAGFGWSHCEGAIFRYADCKRAWFYCAFLDEKTSFVGISINEKTDFCLTALSSVQIEPDKRARLEHNIRRFEWEKWYAQQLHVALFKKTDMKETKSPPEISTCPRQCKVDTSLLRLIFLRAWGELQRLGPWLWKNAVIRAFKVWPVKAFWWVSDYGYSTTRILGCFTALVGFFTLVYLSWPGLIAINSHLPDGSPASFLCGGWQWEPWGAWLSWGAWVEWLGKLLTAFTFSLSTMVTLGFSNINVAVVDGRANPWGLVVVTANLMCGYFMLAVLVTRMAVLFQTMGPGEPKR